MEGEKFPESHAIRERLYLLCQIGDIPLESGERRNTQSLKVELTDKEKQAFGLRMAEMLQELDQLEKDKKRIVDDFKAQAGALESQAGSLATKITTGTDWRDVPCVWIMDDPKTGMKTNYRLDRLSIIESKAMTEQEMQRTLPLNLPPEPEPAKPAAEKPKKKKGTLPAITEEAPPSPETGTAAESATT